MSMRVVVDDQRALLRPATAADAPALHALITAHQDEGHLLPRTPGELAVHAPRFVVAERGPRIIGCAELAPLSHDVAEVRSLVVDRQARGLGLALRMVDRLSNQAKVDGFNRRCPLFRSCGQQALLLPLDELVARRARTVEAYPDLVLSCAQ